MGYCVLVHSEKKYAQVCGCKSMGTEDASAWFYHSEYAPCLLWTIVVLTYRLLFSQKYPAYREEKKRCEYLHEKLSYIKQLIIDYDLSKSSL